MGEELPAPDPADERRERLRARIRAFQILLALGVFSAITGAVISVSAAFALRPAVLALPGVPHDIAVIAIARIWAWAVAPLAAWGAGRVLNARPWVIAFSICAWGEVVYVMFDMAIMGFGPGVYRSLGYFSGRLVTLLLGMLLAWLLARYGRAVADRLKAKHQAEAEATRQRYAKWLEEQTSKRPD
jgi:Kef-type K+ transport system membrane component KefB